jgi:hypothetical protein
MLSVRTVFGIRTRSRKQKSLPSSGSFRKLVLGIVAGMSFNIQTNFCTFCQPNLLLWNRAKGAAPLIISEHVALFERILVQLFDDQKPSKPRCPTAIFLCVISIHTHPLTTESLEFRSIVSRFQGYMSEPRVLKAGELGVRYGTKKRCHIISRTEALPEVSLFNQKKSKSS